VRESACLSRSIWQRVQAAILEVLDSTSLDDLLISEALQRARGHFVPIETLGGTPAAADTNPDITTTKGAFALA
jgi:hypothetical protein